MGASIYWAAADAGTQFTIFDLPKLKKQCLIFKGNDNDDGISEISDIKPPWGDIAFPGRLFYLVFKPELSSSLILF
jgi:hypothetical protein